MRELLYADDAGILFNSRLDMQADLDALVTSSGDTLVFIWTRMPLLS